MTFGSVMPRPKPKVQEIRSGSVVVKIYTTANRTTGELHTVSHYHLGQRVRKNFADLEKAKAHAQSVAAKLSNGELYILTLRDEDKARYVAGLQALQPTGKSLEVACAEYADAFERLRGVGSLTEAVQFFVTHRPKDFVRKPIAEIVDELVAAKKQDGCSAYYLEDLRLHLARLSKKFPGLISDVTASELEEWLRALKLGPRSRNNIRNSVSVLFNFAKGRGYLPKGRPTEAEDLPKAKEPPPKIEILTPSQLEKMLCGAPSFLVPFVTIGAFAGLRHEEIQRLDWEDIDLESGYIHVGAEKAKTAQRRLVQIQPNLHAWLKAFSATGPVSPRSYMTRHLHSLAEAAGIKWPKNSLRHSFGTYRLAQTQNVHQVSDEMGNSPAMVREHYRQLVTKAEADKWWAIIPNPADKASLKTERKGAGISTRKNSSSKVTSPTRPAPGTKISSVSP